MMSPTVYPVPPEVILVLLTPIEFQVTVAVVPKLGLETVTDGVAVKPVPAFNRFMLVTLPFVILLFIV